MTDSQRPSVPRQTPAPNDVPAPASGRELRDLKARGQRLNPVLKIGHAGLSDAFFAALARCLQEHELVKVKFDDLKDRKKELVPELVARSGSQLVQRVGNVAVLFRRRPPAGALETSPVPPGR